MRGQVTKEIEIKARELLNIDITTQELRLMPYIQYVMVNNQSIERNRVNKEEMQIIKGWMRKGWLQEDCQLDRLVINKQFWDAISELIWLGYVYT